MKSTNPVVPGLILIVNPVEVFIGAVLHAVLGHPLVSIAAPLREDPRDHLHLLQVYLQPLPVVLVLGEPCAPGGTPTAPYILHGCPPILPLLPPYCQGTPGSPTPARPRDPPLFSDSPEALAIEAGLVGCPGGVPARVLLRVGAAYLVRGDGARLEAQGLVVGTLCRTRETTCYHKATNGFVSWLRLHACC